MKKDKNNKIETDEFKKLIMDMSRNFPNSTHDEEKVVKKFVRSEKMRKHLVKNGILVLDRPCDHGQGSKKRYFLGVNGLTLANNYLIEEQTSKTMKLTKEIRVLTVIMILLVLLQIALSFA